MIDYEKLNNVLEEKKIQLISEISTELSVYIENFIKMSDLNNPHIKVYEEEILTLNDKIDTLKVKRDQFKAESEAKDLIIAEKDNKILKLQAKIDKLNLFVQDISQTEQK